MGINPATRKAILDRDNWQCRYCGVDLIESHANVRNKATIDHIKPVKLGGKNNWQNLLAACCGCNSRKGDSTQPPRSYFYKGELVRVKIKEITNG